MKHSVSGKERDHQRKQWNYADKQAATHCDQEWWWLGPHAWGLGS